MYPMFSFTSSHDKIGIYYTDAAGEYHEVVVMDNVFPTGDLQFMQKVDGGGYNADTWYDVTGHQPTYGDGHGVNEHDNDGLHVLDNIKAVRGKGVTVSLPKGTVFGMFIIVGDSKKYYSESNLNEDAAVTQVRNTSVAVGTDGAYTVTTDLTKKACHASSFYCTVEGTEYQFLGFEDWGNDSDGGGNSDFDLNDFMVLFKGELPSVNDHETAGWILAYEDLGNSFDWDFNDIVAKVQHVSGQDYATFTPLAAVGTLNSYVKYNGQYITGAKATSEIHALMGATDAAPHAIINGYDKGHSGKSVTFTVPTDFSMTVLGDVAAMGGLTLEVEKDGEDAKAAVIASNAAGETPEVICLPEFWYDSDAAPRFRSEWAWPTEHSSIKYVYPGFATWVSDHNASADWYKAEPQGQRGASGTVGDNNTGAAVTGPFITNVATGTIVERVDPKPIRLLQDPVYVAVNSRVMFKDIFTTESNGALNVTSANTSIASVENGTNYETGDVYANAIGETTFTVRQQMGEGGGKQWPVSEETFTVKVLQANSMTLGVYDPSTGMAEKASLDLVIGESVNLYFYTDAGSDGGAFSASPQDGKITVGEPQASNVINTRGFVRVTAVAAGTSVVTVVQAHNLVYGGVEKTITVNVIDESTLAASGFNVDESNLSLTTIDAPKTITIKSMNSTLPVIDNLVNDENAATLGTITAANSGDADGEGYYSWTLTVTPESAGTVTFNINQKYDATYKSGSQAISVEVSSVNYGKSMSEMNLSLTYYDHLYNYGYYIPASSIEADKPITIYLTKEYNWFVDSGDASSVCWSGDYAIAESGDSKTTVAGVTTIILNTTSVSKIKNAGGLYIGLRYCSSDDGTAIYFKQ